MKPASASVLLAFVLCGSAAMAQPQPIRQTCGGIGSDESTRMREDMKNHPLSLLFAKPGGDYLADVAVRLADADGKWLLDWKADGPVCLLDLPPGRYRVEARSGELVRSREVNVGATPVRVDIRF
ncbi:carboxypeptidase regulatory-like domain-containing protein [Xylophilus sp. GOD-11R]|uniref:carboxypeptidase regulatory-like domain-containing protein n=1 Tax=Xylophilus sp. GOD-11R TaxID=3089814 RepID=UPI00298CAC14|nr:carboxypeptidase regulatory-like domain-containing protein [Xylophilus sp. GOD-11R]WPB56835.1 carboxypeptidase regulatory-like domain-containing protein [Xylophilus sp. GOD-11R]